MSTPSKTVLVVGATGSIGTLVVERAVAVGHRTRALVRPGSAASFAPEVEVVHGDLTRAATLADAVAGIDAVVFTQGTHGGAQQAELVDYGAVRNVLDALAGVEVRIALMTAIGVTKRSDGHDWKRRGERLVRASGLPYTVVRPGWFDHNQPDETRLVLLQGDRRWAGDPSDGVVSRRQIAEVLVASLTDAAAAQKTFELIAERGAAQTDLRPILEGVEPDPAGALDAVLDRGNQPLDDEPAEFRERLARLREFRR